MDASDPLGLSELFSEGGEPWLPLLKPTIEAQPEASAFIGPQRDPKIVPVRGLTFQALKPHAPGDWSVVVFGQNPYPRVESATGIAMFDNAFNDWKDSQFGKTVSMRCIMKAAAIWKLQIPFETKVKELRALLEERSVVAPPEWFQSMLTQGVLLLNASLTASSDGSRSTDEHTAFWRPVIAKIVEEILRAKQAAPGGPRGVVFGWWGAHAKSLRVLVDQLSKKYPGVAIEHVSHCNPAAQGDAFAKGNHFGDVNDALERLGMEPIDWLPSVGWDAGRDLVTAQRMGAFVDRTRELHKIYLERLSDIEQIIEELGPIRGIMDRPALDFLEAVRPLEELFAQVRGAVQRSHSFGQSATDGHLTPHEAAALFLYTTESPVYRQLNATLRVADRSRITPYLGYLRLFFSALSKLGGAPATLFRGVRLDLKKQYPQGAKVIWWGVSSCTPKLSVAQAFLGGNGARTLFRVDALRPVSIRRYSAYEQEEEYIVAPGTQLEVTRVHGAAGLTTVELRELPVERLVS